MLLLFSLLNALLRQSSSISIESGWPGDDLSLAHPGANRHVVRLTSSETLNAVADELVDCAKRIAQSICAASYDTVGYMIYNDIYIYRYIYIVIYIDR